MFGFRYLLDVDNSLNTILECNILEEYVRFYIEDSTFLDVFQSHLIYGLRKVHTVWFDLDLEKKHYMYVLLYHRNLFQTGLLIKILA